MEQINVKVKKWGNSFGVVLPMKVIEKEKLEEGSELTLTLHPKKKTTVADLMKVSEELRLNKKLENVDTKKALREIDKVFWPDD